MRYGGEGREKSTNIFNTSLHKGGIGGNFHSTVLGKNGE